MNQILETILNMRTRETHPHTAGHRIERPVIPLPRTPEHGYVPDRDLTFYRDGMRWTFSSGRVLVDGLDVARLINDNPENVGFFMGIAESLNEYRKRIVAARRSRDEFARFESAVEGLLSTLLGKLKKFYDQKMTGMNWTLQNGQFIMNGINVGSFLALYRLRKTDKAKKFLRGLKSKLAAILENRVESPDYERVREAIQQLYDEVSLELAEEAPRSSRRLLAHGAHAA